VDVAGARRELHRLADELPSSPPVVWVPDHLKEHFGRLGFAELHTQVKAVAEEPDLPAYQRIYWTVELPLQDPARQMGGLLWPSPIWTRRSGPFAWPTWR